MAQDQVKADLIAELAAARARLSVNVQALRRDLDFPARARESFKSNPPVWLGGAALAGVFIARLTGRKKKKTEIKVLPRKDETLEKAGKAGLIFGIVKTLFDLARPFLVKWATQRFTERFSASPAPARKY